MHSLAEAVSSCLAESQADQHHLVAGEAEPYSPAEFRGLFSCFVVVFSLCVLIFEDLYFLGEKGMCAVQKAWRRDIG